MLGPITGRDGAREGGVAIGESHILVLTPRRRSWFRDLSVQNIRRGHCGSQLGSGEFEESNQYINCTCTNKLQLRTYVAHINVLTDHNRPTCTYVQVNYTRLRQVDHNNLTCTSGPQQADMYVQVDHNKLTCTYKWTTTSSHVRTSGPQQAHMYVQVDHNKLTCTYKWTTTSSHVQVDHNKLTCTYIQVDHNKFTCTYK